MKYQDDDLFNIGPILGKGYPEYNDKQPRGKDGKWVGSGGDRSKTKSPKSSGRKPKTTTKPKAPEKKPRPKPKTTTKPKAPEKKPRPKPKSKPKAELIPSRKPRRPRSKEVTQQQSERQSTTLVPANRQEQPIDVQSEPVPEGPASGLVERDRQQLKQQFDRYDAINNELDGLNSRLGPLQDKYESLYQSARYVPPGSWREHSMTADLDALDAQIKVLRGSIDRKTRERDSLRSSIEALDRRLRGQKRRDAAKLFSDADTAIDFRTALRKAVPDNGQPQGVASGNPLGLVFGWAIVCKNNGHPYFDTQGDHIPEDSMLQAATEFMLTKRDLKVMHKGKRVGTVVFAWPVTKDIAKAMGLDGNRTGLMIGVKPDSPTIVDRFKDGQYTGFSIGGNRLIDEPVE